MYVLLHTWRHMVFNKWYFEKYLFYILDSVKILIVVFSEMGTDIQFSANGLPFLLLSFILADLLGNRSLLHSGQKVKSVSCGW